MQMLTAIINGHTVPVTLDEYERIRARAFDGSDDDAIVGDIQQRLTTEGGQDAHSPLP